MCFPEQVAILTRAELLAGETDYARCFVPLESTNEEKNKVDQALTYYEEVRVAPFDATQLDKYIHAYVTLRARLRFEKRFGKLNPLAAS